MADAYHVLKPRDNPSRLSLVIPLYNESEVTPILRAKMEEFLAGLPCPGEVILVNDGSSDRTLAMLLEWAAVDPRIKVIGLARNFGHQVAATAGLDHASGDAVVLMDADLQDPMDVIHEMLAKYREGYDVVYGQRKRREKESWFKRVTAWGFYRIMRTLVHPNLPVDTGDFRLISRRCLDVLCAMREQHRFLRGMVAWLGFAQTAVQYDRPSRAAGTTKYTLRSMFRLAWTAMTSFSSLPLRGILYAGVAIAMAGLAWGGYSVLRCLVYGDTIRGWASLMTVLCVLGGVVLISNAIVGFYVGQIFEEIKQRPLYIVSSLANLAPNSGEITSAPCGETMVLPIHSHDRTTERPLWRISG